MELVGVVYLKLL